MAIPSYVIILQRKGILLKDGCWHLEHALSCEVFAVDDSALVQGSPNTRPRFEDGQPAFKTPRVLQEQGIHRGEISQVQDVIDLSYLFFDIHLSRRVASYSLYRKCIRKRIR